MSETSAKERPKLTRRCGLWERVGRNGETYLSGTLDGRKVLIFKTHEKHGTSSPDWVLMSPGTGDLRDEDVTF